MHTHVENTVQKWRTDARITQEELATRVGVSRQTIISIEKGNYTPSVSLALKIAEVFSTQVELIFTIKK